MKSIPIYHFDHIELFKLLKPPYREAVEGLCREACELSSRTPVLFPEYTLHDSVHLQRVAALAGAIIGVGMKRLRQDEVVLLILASFYHDIGMVCNENEIAGLKRSEEYCFFRDAWRFSHPNMEELETMHRREYVSESEKISIGGKLAEMERAMFVDFLRTKHSEASKQYVLQNLANHPLLGNLAADLGEICLSHGMSVEWIRNHPSMADSRKFLCYVLRLADILDFDGDRTPDVLFKSISFSSQVSQQEWEKHKGVKAWSISDNGIVFSMEYCHPAYEKAARDFLDWIDRELEQVHIAMGDLPGYSIIAPTKVAAQIVSKGYEYHDLSFSLSRDEVINLFLTDKLYGDTSLFVRELLQNSLDALRLRKAVKAMKKEAWEEGQVRFRHYLDEKGHSVVECADNGCGMDYHILEQFFGQVGKSYYRSNEFERLRAGLRQAGVDFDPCSRFGIGFMSVFMVADNVIVQTRKEDGEPYVVVINGLSNLFVIKKGEPTQPVGTSVKIIERSAPVAFDRFIDHIKLVDTIDSYAVACEFPVSAKCSVPGIEDSIQIEPGCIWHQTFLEGLSVKGIKTYEVDFREIDSRLSGRMRQSFLVNKRGKISLNNREARWQRRAVDEYGHKREYNSLLVGAEFYNYYGISFIDLPYTISCDGVTVAGVFGRRNLSDGRKKTRNSDTMLFDRGSVFTLDIRGTLKPELTPARTPMPFLTEKPRGWIGINCVIENALSILWERVLRDCTEAEMRAFWSYLVIYETTFYNHFTSKRISKRVLLDKFFLPVSGGGWIRLADVDSFEMKDDSISVIDKSGQIYPIQLGASILKWIDDKKDFRLYELVSSILLRVAKLYVTETGCPRLVIDNVPSSDREPMYCLKSAVVPFSGVDSKCIMSLSPDIFYNENAPIVRLAAGVWGMMDKRGFEIFADSLCEYLFDYFTYDIDDCRVGFKDAGKHLRYVGALYKSMDKSIISEDYLPPYYILGREGELFEITEALLLEWAEN